MANPVISNTNPSGPGSVRQAFIDAEAMGGTPDVELRCGTGKVEVFLDQPLPIMTQPYRLNCFTQEGSNDDRPMLFLDGAAMPDVSSGVDPVFGLGGLQLSGGGQVMMGVGTKNWKVSSILASAATDTTFVCVSTGLGLDGNALGDVLTPGNIQPGLSIVGSKNTKIGGKKARTDCAFAGSGTCRIDPGTGEVIVDTVNGDKQSPGLLCSTSNKLTILRTRWGMNWAGTQAVRNTSSGVKIDRTKLILIVGCSSGGNILYGYEISHPDSNGARVYQCEAGFGLDGLIPLPNTRTNYIFFNCGYWWLVECRSGNSKRNGGNADGSTPGNKPLPSADYTSSGYCEWGTIRRCTFGLARDDVTPARNELSNWLFTQCQNMLIEDSVLVWGKQDGVLVQGNPNQPTYPTIIPRYVTIRGCFIGMRRDLTPAGHTRHGVFGNYASLTQVGDSGLPDGINQIGYNGGYGATFRKNFFETNVVDPAGNVFTSNSNNVPLIAY